MRRSIHHAISSAPTKRIIALSSVNRFSRDRLGPPDWPGDGKLDMRLQRSPEITRSAPRTTQQARPRSEHQALSVYRQPIRRAAHSCTDGRRAANPSLPFHSIRAIMGGRALYLNGTITAWHTGAIRPKAPPRKRHLLVVLSILFCQKRYAE